MPTQILRRRRAFRFFLTVQGKNAIMMVFSSRHAIQGLRAFQRSGARFFYRRRRSKREGSVQQRSKLLTADGQRNSDREHRAERGTSFRFS